VIDAMCSRHWADGHMHVANLSSSQPTLDQLRVKNFTKRNWFADSPALLCPLVHGSASLGPANCDHPLQTGTSPVLP
jgi:hypothetical protein